jgi:hypothetical protein
MAWNDNARRVVVEMHDSGAMGWAIVSRVTGEFRCDDKTVQKCLAGLEVLAFQYTGTAPELFTAASNRFRIMRGTDRYLNELERFADSARAVKDSPEGRHHREELRAFLLDLDGIGPLPLREAQLMKLATTEHLEWPAAKGQFIWTSDSHWELCLAAENHREWDYLQQHLVDDPFLTHIDDWKHSMTADLAARLELIYAIASIVTGPENEGGTGMPLLSLAHNDEDTAGIHPYFVFALYDQILSRLLDLPVSQKRREDFHEDVPGTTFLGSWPMASSPGSDHWHAAVMVFLKSQIDLLKLPTADNAKLAFEDVRTCTRVLAEDLERFRLQSGLFATSRCDGCKEAGPHWD